MIWYVISSLLMALAGIILYVFYLNRGQFDDAEDVKYQIFRDEEQ